MFALMVALMAVPTGAGALPGRADVSFGKAGLAVVAFDQASIASRIAVQSDGKVVVGGNAVAPPNHSGSFFARPWMVARLDASGRPDPSFGTGGKLSFQPSIGMDLWQDLRDIAIDAQKRILLCGLAYRDGARGIAVARVTRQGTVDPAFGTEGVAMLPSDVLRGVVSGSATATTCAAQSDGKVIVAGTFLAGATVDEIGFEATTSSFVIARLTADGTFDPTFGNGGVVPLVTSEASWKDGGGGDVLVQADDRIVAGGLLNGDLLIARLARDGALDAGFGSGGITTTALTNPAAITSLALQSDGKIVAGGVMDQGPHVNSSVVARYLSNGQIDRSFGGTGVVLVARGRGAAFNPRRETIVIQRDRTIVRSDGVSIARLLANGRADTRFPVARTTSVLTSDFNDVAVQPNGRILTATGTTYRAAVKGFLAT